MGGRDRTRIKGYSEDNGTRRSIGRGPEVGDWTGRVGEM